MVEMNTRNDPRVSYTVRHIEAALIDLMQEKPFRKMTNKEIIERAEVSARSFYRYFKDKNAVLETVEKELLTEIDAALDEDLEVMAKNNEISQLGELSCNSYRNILKCLSQNRKSILALISENGDMGFWIAARNIGARNLVKRFKENNIDLHQLASARLQNMDEDLAAEVFADMMIGKGMVIISNWLKYYDSFSLVDMEKTLAQTAVKNQIKPKTIGIAHN